MNKTRVDALSRALDASGSRRATLVGALLAALGLREHSNVRAGKNKRKNRKENKRQQQCQKFARSDCNSIFVTGTAYNSACYGFLAGRSTLGAPCCPKAKKSPTTAAACMSDHRARYCEILVSLTCPIENGTGYGNYCRSRVLPCCQLARSSMSAAMQCICPGCTSWPMWPTFIA